MNECAAPATAETDWSARLLVDGSGPNKASFVLRETPAEVIVQCGPEVSLAPRIRQGIDLVFDPPVNIWGGDPLQHAPRHPDISQPKGVAL